jgi:hypothetical protein
MNEERPGSVYDKWNISVAMCYTDIPYPAAPESEIYISQLIQYLSGFP